MGNSCSREEIKNFNFSRIFLQELSSSIEKSLSLEEVLNNWKMFVEVANPTASQISIVLLHLINRFQRNDKSLFFTLIVFAQEVEKDRKLIHSVSKSRLSKLLTSLGLGDLLEAGLSSFNSKLIYDYRTRRINLQTEIIEKLAREETVSFCCSFIARFPRTFPVRTSYLDLVTTDHSSIREETKTLLQKSYFFRAQIVEMLLKPIFEGGFKNEVSISDFLTFKQIKRFSRALDSCAIIKLDNDVADIIGILTLKKDIEKNQTLIAEINPVFSVLSHKGMWNRKLAIKSRKVVSEHLPEFQVRFEAYAKQRIYERNNRNLDKTYPIRSGVQILSKASSDFGNQAIVHQEKMDDLLPKSENFELLQQHGMTSNDSYESCFFSSKEIFDLR